MKKNNKGITLIALVVTILVLLILAGVTIKLTIGNNGIISQAQKAGFYSEMTSVEESVKIYKLGNNNEVPVGELCDWETLSSGKRLMGEIGYYRQWNITETKPSEGIFREDDEKFNMQYQGEFVQYPKGVEDLYFLDNQKIGIKSKNEYLIDISTGLIYSLKGSNLNGTKVYSINMYQEISGEGRTPEFEVAEITGSQLEDKLAGNEEAEYGFKIIAGPGSTNIFKLYNNGDLYGKGIKGSQLNTSEEEMKKIDAYDWQEWKIPNKLKGYKHIYMFDGQENLFLIDANDELWAIGENNHNVMGLTQEEQVEYTTREWIKLNVAGKKVKTVFVSSYNTFVITADNELYGAGKNDYGELGIENTNYVEEFTKIDFKKTEKIEDIQTSGEKEGTIIKCNDDTFYYTGFNNRDFIGMGNSQAKYPKFTQIWDGNIGPDIDQDIQDFIQCSSTIVLKKDGTLWISGYKGYLGKGLTTEKQGNFTRYNIENVRRVQAIGGTGILIERNNGEKSEYWGIASDNELGIQNNGSLVKIELPEELTEAGIKEVSTVYNGTYFLSNTGKMYGTGLYSCLGIKKASGATIGIEKLPIEGIEKLNADNVESNSRGSCIKLIQGYDGKIYTTGSSIMFGNQTLQEYWYKIASNVMYFNAPMNLENSSCYIDKENNLWVAGNNSETLGLGTQLDAKTNIPNYIMCADENIKGKAVEAKVGNYLIEVKLKDGSLWSSGYYNKDGNLGYPGWSENANKMEFTKILDNVTEWEIYERLRTAVSNNTLYGWGPNYGGSTGSTTSASNIPIECINLPEELQDTRNIDKIGLHGWQATHIISKSGRLYLTGNWSNGTYWGGQEMTSHYSEYTYNLQLEADEKIKDMKARGGSTAIILTTKGNVYGYGISRYLGIDSTSTELVQNRKLPIDNVKEIIGGNGFFIAIKNDGSVWGTGNNINGVLGRWIGVDRKSPNTRYKTAYTWVECPELEI